MYYSNYCNPYYQRCDSYRRDCCYSNRGCNDALLYQLIAGNCSRTNTQYIPYPIVGSYFGGYGYPYRLM